MRFATSPMLTSSTEEPVTKEPEFNAHLRCAWCHAVRPVKETITFNGQILCRDTDCLQHMRRACDAAPYISDSLPRGDGEG